MISVINKLKNVPFEDVLRYYGYYVPFGKDSFLIFCPFHQDTEPSFYVKNNFGYCFSCQKAWDAIAFIREKENTSYIGALKKLAGIFGIDVSSEQLQEELKHYHKTGCVTKKENGNDYYTFARKIEYKFIQFYRQFDEVYLAPYIDYCWKEFNQLLKVENPTSINYDSLKEWFFKSKQLIEKIHQLFGKNYPVLIRELYAERIDEKDDLGLIDEENF